MKTTLPSSSLLRCTADAAGLAVGETAYRDFPTSYLYVCRKLYILSSFGRKLLTQFSAQKTEKGLGE